VFYSVKYFLELDDITYNVISEHGCAGDDKARQHYWTHDRGDQDGRHAYRVDVSTI